MKEPEIVKRILVVEDEPAIGWVCVRALSDLRILVEVAANGKHAIDALKKGDYDVCLIDVRTPEMNGMELYSYLEEAHPEMLERVIFTTGDVMSGSIREFLQNANRPYLPKPFTPNQLRTAVGACLSQTGVAKRLLA